MDVDKLQNKLEVETMCTIQHTGWPCNSCFHSMNLQLKEDIHKYWEAVLDIRGDYNDYDWGNTDISKFPKLLKELYNAL